MTAQQWTQPVDSTSPSGTRWTQLSPPRVHRESTAPRSRVHPESTAPNRPVSESTPPPLYRGGLDTHDAFHSALPGGHNGTAKNDQVGALIGAPTSLANGRKNSCPQDPPYDEANTWGGMRRQTSPPGECSQPPMELKGAQLGGLAMPYLDTPLIIDGHEQREGTWVPERGWERWVSRAHGLEPALLSWRTAAGTPGSPESPAGPPLTDTYLSVLARDLADAQRDGLLYTNLFERLKNSPDDATADAVIEQMQTLGLASADWPPTAGGPPLPESPRPFRKVLDWLMGLLGKVWRFLLAGVDAIRASLAGLGISAVAVGISLPPQVEFELSTELITRADEWKRAQKFFDGLVTELEEKVFS